MDLPEFGVSDPPMDYEDYLVFGAGSTKRLYLKPEDVGRAVVSGPFSFLLSIPYIYWRRSETKMGFFQCFEDFIQREGSHDFMDSDGNRQNKMRLALCGISPVPIFPPGTDVEPYDDPLLTVPMKIKLFSNYQPDFQAEKERGYLTRLANIFGHQNLTLTMKRSEGEVGEHVITFLDPVELKWNQEELVWEAETEVTFTREYGPLENFGEERGRFDAYWPVITVKLKDAAIVTVLNKQFGFNGHNPYGQRTLEEEINPDLIIIDRNGSAVNCHRFPLMTVSAQLGNMLNDTRGWTEASTRTINLNLCREAILAMLHFIYYGDTGRILSGSTTQALELLQFGHMYELQNLVDVTSFVLMHKADESFTFDDGWQLYHVSGVMMKLEESGRWRDLKEKGSWVVRNYQNWDRDLVKMKASEIYQKLRALAERLGPAFVAALDKTKSSNDGTKSLPINLDDVSMEDCKLFVDYLKASYGFYKMSGSDLDTALALLVLAGHTQCKSLMFSFQEFEALEQLLSKPNTWFEVDHLVALFTLFGEIQDSNPKWATLKLKTAGKLKWFVVNRHDEVLLSSKYKNVQEQLEVCYGVC